MKKTFFIATALVLGCIKIPETGKSALLLTTPSQENQMGKQGYQEVLSKSKVSNDPRLNQALKNVATRLAAQTGRNDFQWEFHIIESKEINAWCMPGGKIAVYTGIIPYMANEAGMATVLGHEIAHATLRHSGQRISQELLLNLGLSVADLTLTRSQYHNQLLGLLGAGATVGWILPYGRGQESEADDVGLRYMARAGYDPKEAVAFWERFSKASGGEPPEFLSTHPGTGHRIEDLKSTLPEALSLYQAAPKKYGAGEKLESAR